MREILLTFAILLISILSFGQDKDVLGFAISIVDKSCPVPFGQVGNLTSAKYDKEKNAITFTISVETELLKVNSLNSEVQTLKETIMGVWASNESSKKMMRMIADCGAEFIIAFESKNGDKSVIVFTPDEIRSVGDGSRAAISPELYLENCVKAANAQCPVTIDELTTLTSMCFENGFLVYGYEIYDAEIVIADLNSNNALRKSVGAALKSGDPNMTKIVSYCKACNYGIIFRYKGIFSGDVYDLKFTTEEI